MMKFFLKVVLMIVFVGCSPSSLEEYQLEGEGLSKELLLDLKRIETAQDLELSYLKLKKRFNKITDLMIAAKQYQMQHPEEEVERNFEMSESLKAEFIRIYKIEGCQEIMEGIQRESLHRLGKFTQKSQISQTETLH